MSLWGRIREAFRAPEPTRRRRRRSVARRIVDAFRREPEYAEPERPERERPRRRDYDERDDVAPASVQAQLIDLGLDDDLAADVADVIDDLFRATSL